MPDEGNKELEDKLEILNLRYSNATEQAKKDEIIKEIEEVRKKIRGSEAKSGDTAKKRTRETFFGTGQELRPLERISSPIFLLIWYSVAFILIIIIPLGPVLIAGLFFLALALFLSYKSGNQTYTTLGVAVIGAIIMRGYLSAFIPLFGFDRLIGLFMTVGAASFMQLITPHAPMSKKDKATGGISEKDIILIFGLILIITALFIITSIEGFYLIIWILSIFSFITSATMTYPGEHILGSKAAKMIPLICLVGAGIFYGLAYSITIGGAMFGGVIDSIMHSLGGTDSSGGSIFDMILNPKLALAAQLKPPTEREYSPGATAPPNIAFTTSFQAIPVTGCYEHSIYTIIGKIKNTGTAFIDDIRLTIKTEEGISNPSVCQSGEVKDSLKKPDGVKGCIWHQGIQIAPGSTISKSCLAGPIPVPPYANLEFWAEAICFPNCEEATLGIQGGDDEILPSHRCFFDITASTAFHSRSRLPIEIIDNSYAKNKYLQGTLVSSIRPSTSSVGPVEFSLGGIEQPLWDNNDAVTMIVSTVNTGNGEVNEYSSIYLLIPKNLLDEEDGKPTCNNEDWACFDYEGPVYEYSDGDGVWKDNAEALKQFAEGGGVGSIENFKLTYDSSLDNEVLKSDYAICFYNKEISGGSLMQTATCNLKMRPNPEGTLRRTEIIRGDVLYTYRVTSDASFEVRDCTI